MRIIILVAVLSSAVASYGIPSYGSTQQLFTHPRDLSEDILRETTTLTALPITTNAESSSSSTLGASSSTTPPLEIQTTLKPSSTSPPKDEEPPLLEETNSNAPSSAASISQTESDDDYSPKRRVITYDQRQEGQYNIRADLENFMIVLIPPSPSEGINLLELLTRGSLRRNSHTTKGKKKHYSGGTSLHPNSVKFGNAWKGFGGSQNFNYAPRTSMSSSQGKQPTPVAIIDSAGHAQRLPEFIEGRTPYHVDISASDDEQSRLHPERQVDVLPPPYPLAYQHLIKPYHLEAEPTIIQALPPTTDLSAPHVSASFFDSYNQLLNSGLQNSNSLISSSSNGRSNLNPELGFYRISRALRGDNVIDSNNLNNPPTTYGSSRHTQLPLYRSDLSFGASSLYPPIDVPRASNYLTLHGASGRTLELSDAKEETNEQSLESNNWSLKDTLPQDDVEYDVQSVGFLNADAKALLSDGMERCAPGFRRDSYGLCREIEGY